MPQGAERPEDRFAPDAEIIDLNDRGRELLAKAADSSHAHAQQTLYKHSDFTTALFAFQAGGSLPEHRARGTVTIQTVSGKIRVRCASEHWSLAAGRMLRLAPGIAHAVECDEPSVMLVHVGLVH